MGETGEKVVSVGDLKQKIIDYLYNLKNYSVTDVELIKIIFK